MSDETTARPFRVGDRVRITDYLRHDLHPEAQYVYDGIVENIDPAADPESGLVYGPYLWAKTEEYTSPTTGEVFDQVFCEMTADLTTGSDGADTLGRTIELLEPATTDSSPTTPQDHGPLAAPVSDRTLAKVLSRPAYDPPSPTKDAIVEAALRWHAIRNANAADVTPLALFDADDALNMAVRAHIAAVVS